MDSRGTGSYAVHKDKIAYRVIEEEAVLLNVDKGVYYCLNKTGTAVWECLAQSKGVAEILKLLSRRFPDVPLKRLEKDLHEVLRDLEKEQLIYRKK